MQNDEVAVDVLRLVSTGDVQAVRTHLTTDASMELPFAPSGVESTFKGTDAIIGALEYVAKHFRAFSFNAHEIYVSAGGDTVILEATSMAVRHSGGCYQNRYVFVFTFRNNKILRWREFFNPDFI
ncbi:MAG: nuclear transport factor 2 family protein [Pseudomonadota bacterium]